ncbi:DNA-binding transcriptional ArsR family regulator [Rahnella sp. BIGb0603]|jgi:DNA-binding transcriptional ArsR family regulator|uniref:ArsR/SmtB family transcription factor n=1 Tax=Rahnella TaxID=34037 RepID=UPI00216A678E|nr:MULTISPECIES: winged helix-turn-helix domain-containing protein [Rahnella]MCS3424454.1 DNA-binding transcriptional ArsR family regulator [Rahnella sp. BIGb0603]MDF1894941.1 winged helix-turn-helix domain-containing protein [Rahnella contaminans]
MSLPNVRKTDDDGLQLELSLSAVASAIADPSRVSMLCALMDGRAWTATELSSVANIAASTASAHLTKLLNSELITCLSQGRHRYYRLAGSDVAHLLETLMGISMKSMKSPQPKTPVHLRVARTCYDHLAGKIAVGIYEFMSNEGWLEPDGNALTPAGKQHIENLGAILNPNTRRKSSCACLDWSERRFHLGGDSGAALLAAFERKGWLNRTPGYREVTFTEEGKRAFLRIFQIDVK